MPVIETERLTKRYGLRRGIEEVDLRVEAGEVFGFLGPNGAGKTTLIRLLVDLIRPTAGRALVFGIPSSADPVAIHRRIGYLPGEYALYDRLTGAETLDWFASLRGGVDRAWQRSLIERFDLDPARRHREYSRGNRQKVGLIIALQHRPELLILDEPTTGLDPLVQQTFLQVLRETTAEGRTVFLSSHLLGEVERSCDRVGIIRDGRIVTVDRVAALRDLSHHALELRFAGPVDPDPFRRIDGVSEIVAAETTLRMRVSGPIGPVVTEAARHGLLDLTSHEPSLEEAFLAHYGPGAARVPDAR